MVANKSIGVTKVKPYTHDSVSRLIYIETQVSLGSVKTIISKERFKE